MGTLALGGREGTNGQIKDWTRHCLSTIDAYSAAHKGFTSSSLCEGDWMGPFGWTKPQMDVALRLNPPNDDEQTRLLK